MNYAAARSKMSPAQLFLLIASCAKCTRSTLRQHLLSTRGHVVVAERPTQARAHHTGMKPSPMRYTEHTQIAFPYGTADMFLLRGTIRIHTGDRGLVWPLFRTNPSPRDAVRFKCHRLPASCITWHSGDARLSSHSRVNWGNVIACGQRHGSAAVWCIHPRARWDTPAMIGTYRPRVSVTRSSSRSTVVTPLTVSTRRRWLRLLVATSIGNCVAVR